MDDGASRRPLVDALTTLVHDEGRRLVSEAALEADPARIAEGYARRFVTDAKRAAEAVELYELLGFDVVADPVRVDQLEPDCTDCQLVMLLNFKTIYTRRRKDADR